MRLSLQLNAADRLTVLKPISSYLLAAVVGFLAVSAESRASSWYVSASATGAHNGTTINDAWTTLASVKQKSLNPGDVVYVYSGTYDERFTITNSGAPGQLIAYKGVNNGGGNPVVLGVMGNPNVSYIAILDFEIYQGTNAINYSGIKLQSGNGWLIQDNFIHGINGNGSGGQGSSAGIELDYNTVNSYNIIRCNTLQDLGVYSGSAGNWPINIIVRGSYNLIEYNTLGRGNDRVNVFGNHNIVRNNSFTPMTETDLGSTSDPHIDDFQSFYPTDNSLSMFLFERNFGNQNDSDNAHHMIIRDTSGTGGLSHVIDRFNISSRNGSIYQLFEGIDVLRTYNNTVSRCQDATSDPCYYAVIIDPNSAAHSGMGGTWLNNSFTNSVHNTNTQDFISNSSGGYFTVTEDYNHIYPSGAAAGSHSVVAKDPLFNNAAGVDFTLQSSSPLHNAGGPLTKAVGSGFSSGTLDVADVAGLCDGWGIADGDFIKVGSNGYVQLGEGAINYQTNTITLPSNLSWTDGDPVSVKGMSDIGALPYQYATPVLVTNTSPTSASLGSISLTASVSNPDAVRKVEYLVDGLPVGFSYASPYSVTWPVTSGSHSIEARAYSAWASARLYTSSFVSFSSSVSLALPVITSPASASAVQGSSFSYSITATGSPTSYAASGLPSGLSINASNGAITGQPTTSGAFSVTISATSAAGTSTATLTLTVSATPSVPAINSALTATATKGSAFSYSITASNSPISFKATGLPTGLTLNTSSGAVSGTPTVTGIFSVTISATNSAGTDSTTLALTVNQASVAPSITSPATASATKGSAFSYRISASNSPTSYSATGLPAGLAINISTGAITGSPSVMGTFSVTISATNSSGTGSATLSIKITATSGVPNITSLLSVTATQGSWFSYTIVANNSPISFNAAGLPSGLSVNTGTGVISGTPTISGVYDVTINATNPSGTGYTTLTLAVTQTLFPPVLTSVATASGAENATFSYSITASGSPTSYSASGLPAGLSLNSSTGAITGTPTVMGNFNVSIGATNAGGTTTASLAVTISHSPVPVISSATKVSAIKGVSFTYKITASNSPTSFGASGLPSGLSINSTTGVISGMPKNGNSVTVSISATNSSGTGMASLTIAVSSPGSASPALDEAGPNARLINLSIRANAGVGSQTLITGFVVSGGSKSLLVRGIGPSLADFGVTGYLPDPNLVLFQGSNEIAFNSVWGGAAPLALAMQKVGAFPLLPTSIDSALLSTLSPGAYTAQISSLSGDSGIVLAEIYDADPLDSPARLTNVSALAPVGTGPNILIAGFVIGGTTTETVLIRGIGPSLSSFGVANVLANPQLTLSDSHGNVIASNSEWGGSSDLSHVFQQVGAFALPDDSTDAALVTTLQPGFYTVGVSGSNQTTGTALVEIYEVPQSD